MVKTVAVVFNSAIKCDIGLDQTRSNSSWRVNRCSMAIKLYEECGLSHDGDTAHYGQGEASQIRPSNSTPRRPTNVVR